MAGSLMIETNVYSSGGEDVDLSDPRLRARLNFSDPAERAAHVRAFYQWLPPMLHSVPGITWERLPCEVMSHLIRTVADDPDAVPIALAVGCAMDAMKGTTLLHECSCLTTLLRRLRTTVGFGDIKDLREPNLWERFVAGRTLTTGEVNGLQCYDALANRHLRRFLETLNARERQAWEPYVLPPPPVNLADRYGQRRAAVALAQQRRKAQSDVLVPLFPLLVQVVQFRKQAVERLLHTFRQECACALAGEIALPHAFAHRARIPTVTEDAGQIAAVAIVGRPATLALTLWDRVSWVRAHPERYSAGSHENMRRRVGAYAPENNTLFLQYAGAAEDLLWFGDIVVHRALGRVKASSAPERIEWARRLGEPYGFCTERPGLLAPTASDANWFQDAVRPGEMLLEPESLYRGVLYGAALATLALTNASRVTELLQVSADRFQTIVVDELKDRQPTGRKMGILVQHLLPKGCATDSQRQYFLIADQAGRLLTEIGQGLIAAHGGRIPVVQPSGNRKAEDLRPEAYLFQWGAGPDGRLGLLDSGDVRRVLRFLFHGLKLATRDGQPIRIGPHLLRHVLATHARHTMHVPAEAIAYLLHHRASGDAATPPSALPEATRYYSQMPVDQQVSLLFEVQATLMAHGTPTPLHAPAPRDLAHMDAALRQVFEEWGTIGPTAFGYCGAGLCVRCPHLVVHYRSVERARAWRQIYVRQADLLDADGQAIDAAQARRMVGHLDDIITLMRLQREAVVDGGYLPAADVLPIPGREGAPHV